MPDRSGRVNICSMPGPKGTHQLSEVDPAARTALCSRCGPVRVRGMGMYSSGRKRFTCAVQHQLRKKGSWNTRSYRRRKTLECARCGFVAYDPCQLDVNHRNGQHSDNRLENLETLCANCHRLVTKQGHHGIYRPAAERVVKIFQEVAQFYRRRGPHDFISGDTELRSLRPDRLEQPT